MNKKRQDRFEKQRQIYQPTLAGEIIPAKPESPEGYSLDRFTFSTSTISKGLNILKQTLEFQISNLTALGLLKWETGVDVSAERSSDDPEDKNIDVDVDVYNNDDFIFTPLGDRFVKVCETK